MQKDGYWGVPSIARQENKSDSSQLKKTTHPDMIVFSTRRKPVRVSGIILLLSDWWARFFEGGGLKVAG